MIFGFTGRRSRGWPHLRRRRLHALLVFIIAQLAWESKAEKLGTFVLFLASALARPASSRAVVMDTGQIAALRGI